MDNVNYYKFDHPNVGERYFKVTEDTNEVLQIITKSVKKTGRPYQKGINFMRYSTFVGSWGLSGRKKLQPISRNEFYSIMNSMICEFEYEKD